MQEIFPILRVDDEEVAVAIGEGEERSPGRGGKDHDRGLGELASLSVRMEGFQNGIESVFLLGEDENVGRQRGMAARSLKTMAKLFHRSEPGQAKGRLSAFFHDALKKGMREVLSGENENIELSERRRIVNHQSSLVFWR
jgi:hypothetical protein